MILTFDRQRGCGDVVPLSAHPFHPKGRTLSHSGHLNWIVLWPQ